MEQKVQHTKMHKVKKNWVTIGVTALSMVTVAEWNLVGGSTGSADEQILRIRSGDSSQICFKKHLPQLMMQQLR